MQEKEMRYLYQKKKGSKGEKSFLAGKRGEREVKKKGGTPSFAMGEGGLKP